MFEVKIVRNCSKCKGVGRVSGVLNNRRVKCAICDGRGSMDVTLIVNAATKCEAEEMVRTDGYRQLGRDLKTLFDPYAGDVIALVERIESNLYQVQV